MRNALRPVFRPARRERKSEVATLPPATFGWVLNESIMANSPQSARWLENWFPTDEGVRVRKGAARHATIDDDLATPITSFLVYQDDNASRLFAATATQIFDVTAPADASVAVAPVQTQLTAGYWSFVNFSNVSSSHFMVAVNGSDYARIYNGANWKPILDSAVVALNYDAGNGVTFSVGDTLTGGTSGATAEIVDLTEATGTTGTLYIAGVTGGPFQDNETITDASGASATADGVVSNWQTLTISGVGTNALSTVWAHGRRLWFTEKDTLWAWYFDSALVFAGAMSSFNLSALFQKGGKLLFGTTWSMDAGDGMDDRCVFVTDQGEVAVYSGTDPSSVSTWSLVGRYDIARPLGPRAFTHAGGDLLIATEEGIVPLSQVVVKEPGALSASAVTRAIEPVWRQDALARRTANWEMAKKISDNWLLVSLPAGAGQTRRCYVVNLKTGGWALWTGWDAQCLAERNGEVYFGTSQGRVFVAENGGTDDGALYECNYAGPYGFFGMGQAIKQFHMMRATFTASSAFTAKLSVSRRYEIDFPSPPGVATAPAGIGVWDVSNWDEVVFLGSTTQTVFTNWKSIGRSHEVVAPQVQVTIRDSAAPDVQLSGFDVLYEGGDVVV